MSLLRTLNNFSNYGKEFVDESEIEWMNLFIGWTVDEKFFFILVNENSHLYLGALHVFTKEMIKVLVVVKSFFQILSGNDEVFHNCSEIAVWKWVGHLED